MDCIINNETKTLDFCVKGVVISRLSFEEAARRGVPFTRDEKDYNTLVLDVSELTAVTENSQLVVCRGDNELTRLDVG